MNHKLRKEIKIMKNQVIKLNSGEAINILVYTYETTH